MRKKSHISLARFLVQGLDNEVLLHRKKAFYVGSLLPDCKPSFLTVRHEYDETIEMVERRIRRLIENPRGRSADSMRYMIELGQIIHYLADYFTFPHNRHYPGSLKEHCLYEKYLKYGLRSYIRRGDAVFYDDCRGMDSVDDVLDYIRGCHQEYMECARCVEEDCEYITRVCSQVLACMECLARQSAAVCAA